MSVASSIVLPRLRLSSKKVISTQIYDFLRKLIIETTIKPGTLLSENGLSEHFHVSRQPVREALMGLSYEGLLSVLPQRGSVVERISVSRLQQTVFVRTAIEKECVLNYKKLDKRARHQCLKAAESAAIDATAAAASVATANGLTASSVVPAVDDGLYDLDSEHDTEHSNELLGAMQPRERRDSRDSKDKDLRATYFRLDDSFHEHLCGISGGGMAWNTIQLIKGQMDRIRFLTFNRVTPTEVLTEEHRQILEYLKAEDYERCLSSLEAHLSTINESHKPVIREYSEWFTPESVAHLKEEDLQNKQANEL